MKGISLINLDLQQRRQNLQYLLIQEQERWILGLPVTVGLGIVFYFLLSFEPSLLIGLLGTLIGGVFLLYLRNKSYFWLLLGCKCFFWIMIGFVAAQLKTYLLSTVLLTSPTPFLSLTGNVVKIEKMTNRVRLTLGDLQSEDTSLIPLLNLIRLSCRGKAVKDIEALQPGQRISVKAKLLPPNEPIAPGAYDFRRKAYFEGISAVGYTTTSPKVLTSSQDQKSLWFMLANIRHQITETLRQNIGDVEGAIAASLITGDRSGIEEKVRQDFADSGLAHILAISGLHLSIAAGLAFFFMRKTLSLFPAISLYYPVKKVAAGVAIFFTSGYLFISGLTIPAQRAFVMTGLVLIGVLVDRTVVTLRNVALTATVILLITPDSLMSPSFQMSFAAVTALVAGYKVLHQPLTRWRTESPSRGRKFLFYLLGISLSTVLATVATTPYIIYTFNRLTLHAIPANLITIPLLSFVIMPLLILFLLSFKIGLSSLIVLPLKYALKAMIEIASQVSSWPGSVVLIPTLSPWALATFTIGALWIVIWKGRWRWQGLWGIGLCLGWMFFDQPADIYINPDKKLVMFYHQGKEHQLIVNSMRSGRFAREAWMKRTTTLKSVKIQDFLKQEEKSTLPKFLIETPQGYRLHFKKGDVDFQEEELTYYQDWQCRLVHQGTQEILMFPDVKKEDPGGTLLWITSQGFKRQTVADDIGHRPWNLRKNLS